MALPPAMQRWLRQVELRLDVYLGDELIVYSHA